MSSIYLMTYEELGRFIASRTAYPDAALIAQSDAPELRYDMVMHNVVNDPQYRSAFSDEELIALIERMWDSRLRTAAKMRFSALTGTPY